MSMVQTTSTQLSTERRRHLASLRLSRTISVVSECRSRSSTSHEVLHTDKQTRETRHCPKTGVRFSCIPKRCNSKF